MIANFSLFKITLSRESPIAIPVGRLFFCVFFSHMVFYFLAVPANILARHMGGTTTVYLPAGTKLMNAKLERYSFMVSSSSETSWRAC